MRVLLFALTVLNFSIQSATAQPAGGVGTFPTTEISAAASTWVRLPPDSVLITVELSEQGLSAVQARKNVENLTGLVSQAVETIGKSGIKVGSRGEYFSGVATELNRIKGSSQMKFTRHLGVESFNLAQTAELLEAITKVEGAAITDIQTRVRGGEVARQRAIEEATKGAVEKARVAAAAAGAKLGRLSSLVVTEDSEADLVTREKLAGSPLEGITDSELEITANVRFEIAP